MKVVIAGSRNLHITDEEIFTSLQKLYGTDEIDLIETELVSGGARGVDSDAEYYARNYGYRFKKFPAQWRKYGLSAGDIRNREMAEYGDALIVKWDGVSRGTKNMIDKMLIRKKPIIYAEQDNTAKGTPRQRQEHVGQRLH